VGTHDCGAGSDLEVVYAESAPGEPSTVYAVDATQGSCRFVIEEGGDLAAGGPFRGTFTASLVGLASGSVEINEVRFHYE
jgi:hypothetical protein